jgi:phage replication initiation protein
VQITNTPSNEDQTKKILVPEKNRILIDWFSGTFLHTENPQEVIKLLGLSEKLFTPRPKSANGYKQALACGNITIFFDGQKDMGVNFVMSGDGCRQYEAQFTDSPWIRLIGSLIFYEGNICRFDLANDIINGIMPLGRLEECIRAKQVRTRFKRGKKTEDLTYSENDTDPCGLTINLNKSRQSLVFIRFYDKAAQNNLDCSWIRSEIEFKGERALIAATALFNSMPAGELFFAVMNNYFTIINLDDSNKSRCTTQDWWQTWLEHTNKVKLTVAKAIKTIEKVRQWFFKSCAPSLAMIKEHCGMSAFNDFVSDLLYDGGKRMSMKHEQILFASGFEPVPLPI